MRLTTKRLNLRPVEQSDVAAITSLANDYDIASQTAAIPYPLTEQDVLNWLEEAKDDINYTILLEDALIGNIRAQTTAKQTARLSYWLAKDHWGQGFMTEAAVCFARFLFDENDFSVIVADRAEDNAASGKVLEKVGFHLTGPVGCYSKARKENVPCLEYRLEKMV